MGARRIFAALVALAGFVLPATSSAATAEDAASAHAARIDALLPDAQVSLRGRPSDTPLPLPSRLTLPHVLSEAKRDPNFDVRTLGKIARAAIKTYTGADLASPADAPDDQPLYVGFDGGDLDGDGRADVLAFVEPPDAQLRLEGRAGSDGSKLWDFEFETNLLDAYIQPLANDAGGSDAVTVTQLSIVDGSVPPVEACENGGIEEIAPVCLYSGTLAIRWQLDVIDGETGAVRWSKHWDGSITEASATSFQSNAGSATSGMVALNGFVVVMPADDHDGDGVQDLVIDEVDIFEGFAMGDAFNDTGSVFGGAGGFVTATRASVVRASDGGILGARASAGPGIAFLSPGVDGIGDATKDLLWDSEIVVSPAFACTFTAEDGTCVEPGGYQRMLEMIDGATLLPGWVVPLEAGWILSAEGDIDGDGSEDLAHVRFGEQLSTAVLSGASGIALWSADEVLLGPVGEGQVLGVNVIFDYVDVVYVFTRRSGTDGALVSSTEHHVSLPQDAFDLFIIGEFSRIPDVDGDGDHDAFGQITIYANETTVDVGIEHGRSGAPIFTRHADGEVFAVVIEDTNGDARADLLDITPVYHRRSFDLTLAVRRLPGALEAWSKTTRLHSQSFITLDLSADIDGDSGSDLIVSSGQIEEAGLRAVLTPLAGMSGATLWQVGGPLADPPPVPTGGIAGTLTGAGAPFQGACISVVDSGGEEIAFTVTAADGTYVVAELDDGTYRMWFGDCFFGTFVEEWYDDAASMEAATPVVVTGGAITTGIDGDLAPAA